MASMRETFFAQVKQHHNVDILKTASFDSFFNKIKPYGLILEFLQNKGYLKNKKIPSYTPLRITLENNSSLKLTAVDLVTKELPQISSNLDKYHFLSPKIKHYIEVICDVFKNQLAQRNYEPGIPDQENISERDHGLQAAKIAFHLGLPAEEVLAMLFHDIARITVDHDKYGHANHHDEGSKILAPLGLAVNFTFFHGLAKLLLNEFCPPYKNLISPVSFLSLEVQQANFRPQIEALNLLHDKELAKFIEKIMFLRLIDDLSKVPKPVIEQVLRPVVRKVEYFNDLTIKHLLYRQFILRLTRANVTRADLDNQLDIALELLGRAKNFSDNSQLYRSSIECKL